MVAQGDLVAAQLNRGGIQRAAPHICAQRTGELLFSYIEYYSTKLETRATFENIFNIDNNTLNNMISFELATNVEKCFSDAYDPIKKLLLLLRSNYEYILKIVSIIDEDEKILEESKTLVDLFCHQFYENILIPNPEQEELLILSYLLLEKEVISMNSASASSFIDENASFVGNCSKISSIYLLLSLYFAKILQAFS